MSPSAPKDLAASALQRLVQKSRESGDDPNLLFIRYAIERLLYRISVSNESNRFILKGAMLFSVWTQAPHRSTRDLDLLGFGEAGFKQIESVFRSLCHLKVCEDGLRYDPQSIRHER